MLHLSIPLPDFAGWQWILGAFCAFMIGIAKTGAPGIGTLISPLMVITVGDARLATAWALPVLLTADVFAVAYWRRHADHKQIFALIPWVLAGVVGGAFALSLSEIIIRRMIGVIVVVMMVIYLRRRMSPTTEVHGNPIFYGSATGFSSTVANAAGPVMNLFLLSRNLPKERFIGTGAWFFLILNVVKSPVYAYHGLYSLQSLTFDLCVVPAVFLGAVTGRWLIFRIPQKLFEALVVAMTVVSCLLLFR